MTDHDTRKARQISTLQRHFLEARKATGLLAGFCASTGLTTQHLVVVDNGLDATAQLSALEWAIDNEATPAEMMAWHRLQNG